MDPHPNSHISAKIQRIEERGLPIPTPLAKVLEKLPSALIIGGAVRDWLLGFEPKDIDIEVYNKTPEELLKILSPYGVIDEVGKSFGVIKLTVEKETYDFSLPRKDSKTGIGHKGFSSTYDPWLTPHQAAKRRDLTMNAMGWSPKNKELIDPFQGQKDLERKILRHTSSHFSEDPLRPLRCFQFSARFSMDVAPETALLCQEMAAQNLISELPTERISEEFSKFLLKGKNHLKGFNSMHQMGWLSLFPELQGLWGLEQDPEYHPEGDVLTHTSHCLTHLVNIEYWKNTSLEEKLLLSTAVLCHDLGKASTTKREWKDQKNRWVVTSAGHDQAGIAPTRSLTQRIGTPKKLLPAIELLVAHHMSHLQIKTKKDVRKLAAQLSPQNPHAENARITTSIKKLAVIVESDHGGRPPLEKALPDQMKIILKMASELGCLERPITPLLNGTDATEKEYLPQGKAIGEILKQVYKAQIDGKFTTKEGASQWLKKNKRQILLQSKLGPTPLLNGKDFIEMGIVPSPIITELSSKAYELQLQNPDITEKDMKKRLLKDIENALRSQQPFVLD